MTCASPTQLETSLLLNVSTPSLTKTYAVPRRFGMGALLAFITLGAVVLGILPRRQTATWVYLFLGVLGVAVCIGQMYFTRAPRLVSIVAGAIFLPLLGLRSTLSFIDLGVSRIDFTILLGFVMAISGGIAGYIAGAVAAGVFLLGDQIESRLRGRHVRQSETDSVQPSQDVPYYSPDSCAPYLGDASAQLTKSESAMSEDRPSESSVKKLEPPVGVPVFNCKALVSSRRADGLFHARAAELNDLRTSGSSEREALQHLVGAFKIIAAQCLSEGRKLPFLSQPHAPASDEQERFIAVHL